jgi:FemAB-related protein (PEP-CTERM system-associated)
VSFSEEKGSNYLELRYLNDPHLDLPEQKLYVTYIKELEKSEEDILTAIPRKSRASIRNGYKKFQLYSKVDRNVNILYDLYVKNKKNLGSPVFSKVFFEQLLKNSGEESGVLTVYYNSTPISSVIFFAFKDTIFPTFSGADNSYNYTNMNNIMYYELMKYALNNGYKYFDFGRSRKGAGSGKFKENMGFEAKQLHYYFHMHKPGNVPNISPSNDKFKWIINTWSKLPLFMIKFLGPKLIKLFP